MKKSPGELIRNWWVGKGCVQHSDRLKDYADRLFRIRLGKRDSQWELVLKKHIGEVYFSRIIHDIEEDLPDE